MPPPYPEHIQQAMVASYQETRSLVVTAAQFNCSPTTVSRYVRDAGLTLNMNGGRHKRPGSPPQWHRRVAKSGYVVYTAWVPEHARTGHKRQGRTALIFEHRLVMEMCLGRPLERR